MNLIPKKIGKKVLAFRLPLQPSSLLKTALGSLGLKISAAGMGLINGVLLARILGPADFGVYSIAMAAVTLFATLAALGLPTLVTREMAVHQAKEHWPLLKGLLATSQLWVLLASMFFVLAGSVFGLLERIPSALTMIGWVSAVLLIPLVALNQLRAAILRGVHFVITADVPDLLLRPLVMLAVLGCSYVLAIPVDADYAILIQLIAVSLALWLGSRLLVTRLPKPVWQAKAESTNLHWFKSSGVFLTIAMVGLLEAQFPLYLLGYMTGPEQAGLFQAANQIVGVVVMGLVAVNLPLQPRLAAAWALGDVKKTQGFVTEAARLGSGGAIAAALVLIPFAPSVMGLYGPQFESAATVLQVLVFGQMLNAFAGPCGVVLAMTGNQVMALYGLLAALVVSIASAYLLIPGFGVIGAAWANAIGIAVWNVILVLVVWHKTRIVTIIK